MDVEGFFVFLKDMDAITSTYLRLVDSDGKISFENFKQFYESNVTAQKPGQEQQIAPCTPQEESPKRGRYEVEGEVIEVRNYI